MLIAMLRVPILHKQWSCPHLDMEIKQSINVAPHYGHVFLPAQLDGLGASLLSPVCRHARSIYLSLALKA